MINTSYLSPIKLFEVIQQQLNQIQKQGSIRGQLLSLKFVYFNFVIKKVQTRVLIHLKWANSVDSTAKSFILTCL